MSSVSTSAASSASIYKKLAKARQSFHARKLTKSGHNKFAGYKYFELGDFVQAGMECLNEQGLVPVISFDASEAKLTLFDTQSDSTIVITSPMADAQLKGCHPIQNLGAVQTYQRRYLWVTLLEIIEHDALDSSKPLEDKQPIKASSSELKKLTDAIVSSNRNQDKMLSYFKVEQLKDLTSDQVNQALEMIARSAA